MEASSNFFVGSHFSPGPDTARTQFSSMDNNNNNNNNNNNVNHFMVDDLLDFSKEDDEVAMTDAFFLESLAGNSADESPVTAVDSCNSSVSGADATLLFSGSTDVQLSGSDLCVPYEDLAELEWLSNFVEESFSSDDMQFIPAAKPPSSAATDVSSSISPPILSPDVSVPGKARSKRSRAAPCDWSSRLLLLSPATSSSDSTDPVQTDPVLTITKRVKHRESAEAPGRKCLHCGSEKTPQWRAGPMGPNTLCNACGVRYKSGRLVPEYRPAASPTFVSSKHSNSHRKVMELRSQKELAGGANSVFCSSNGGGDFFVHHHQQQQQQQQMCGSDFSHMI